MANPRPHPLGTRRARAPGCRPASTASRAVSCPGVLALAALVGVGFPSPARGGEGAAGRARHAHRLLPR